MLGNIWQTTGQIFAYGAFATVGGLVSSAVVNSVADTVSPMLGKWTRPVLNATLAGSIGMLARFLPFKNKRGIGIALAALPAIKAFAGIVANLWTTPPAQDSFLLPLYDAVRTTGMSDYLQVGDDQGDAYAGTEDYLQVGDDDGMGALYEAGLGAMYEAGLGYSYHEEEVESAAAPF